MKTIYRIFILALLASSAFSCEQLATVLPLDYSGKQRPSGATNTDIAPVTEVKQKAEQAW